MALTQVNSAGIADGAIVNADVNNSAAVALSKLSTSGTASSSTFLRGDGAWTAIDLANLSASNLTSGTVPDARFPATLPALSGTALTNLNASNISSGTLAAARLPASYAVLSGSTNNQIATVTGANALTGEASLTFDAGLLKIDDLSGTAGKGRLEFGNSGEQYIEGFDTGNGGSGSYLAIGSNTDERLRITSGGDINIHNRTAASSTDPVTVDFGGQYTPDASITHQNLKVKLFSNSSNNDAGGLTMGQSGVSYVASVGAGHLFYTAPSAVDTLIERLRITHDGNVGIGVTPSDLLHLKFGTNLHMRFNDDVDSIPTISSQQDGGAYNIFGLKVNSLRIQTGTSPAERLRIDSSGRVLLGTTTLGHGNADDLTVHNSGHCGITIRSGSSNDGNIFFADADSSTIGTLKYDHTNNAFRINTNGAERLRITSDGTVLISNDVVLTGNTNSNIISERVQILPSENDGYDDSHILSAAQTAGNWEQGAGTSNVDSSWGWLWQYAVNSGGTKQIRAGIAYDHKGAEEFKYWSSYGSHTWYVDSGTSGDETADTCDKKAMQICPKGSVINTANPTYGIYTQTGVQTANGGSKTVQYLEDCMGQWIVVAKIQQSSHLQAAMASVAQIDTSTGQATGTEWSSSFGTTYPIAVRYVSSSNWKNWRDHRGVDFIQGVPHGRQWRHFFTNGNSSGMTTATGGVGATKYGWTCDGAWDGKGRWHNPTFNWWRMTDHGDGIDNDYVSASFFTSATAANASTALYLNWANDAKFGVHHSGATGGQDTEVTSVYGYDDNVYGHEDNYPNAPSHNSGSDITAMPLWICINVSAVGQFH